VSAVDNYRQSIRIRTDFADEIVVSARLADAAIAELEGQLSDCAKTCGGLEYKLEQAEAQLDEAKRCWDEAETERIRAEAPLAVQKALLPVVPTARWGKS
jgi:chromosome segregation ATPase